ncbi:MAG: heavy metal translocating P-type ATPase [Burkholderiales bacterium]
MNPVSRPACFHCGLPVLPPSAERAVVLGAAREFCCSGCAAVAQAIVAGGFERYYETRELPQPGAEPGPLPAGLPPASTYDDPAAQRQFVLPRGEHEREATLILDRLHCTACVWLTESWLRRQPGILRADVNAGTRRAVVAWDARETRLGAIIEAIRAIGYEAWPWDPARQDAVERGERRRALWRLFVAGFGAMQVMMYAFPAYIDGGETMSADAESLMRWASLILTLPVLLISCQPFFASAWRELRLRRVGLDTPISLGIVGGFAASAWATVSGAGEVYFDSIAMLVFLLLAARWAELAARGRAGRELDRVLRWMPEVALRLRDPADAASVERVGAHELAAGEHVLVPAGERVPADGVVVHGASGVDESLLTGEARAVAKSAGSALAAGAVNLEQPLVMRVTHAGADTGAAAIGRLVERAAATRPQLVSAADRIAGTLTAVVLGAAALAFIVWLQLEPGRAAWIAVAVLVATCPCALALAAPIALTAASSRLLARGIVQTRGRAIEALARATDVVFDKTGTLTQGQLSLAATTTHAQRSVAECLAIAQALEAGSRHPAARAFLQAPAQPLPAVSDLLQVPGRGVEARVAGERMRIGSASFCAELAGSAVPPTDASVHLAGEPGWLASFRLEDATRTEAQSLLATLRGAGLRIHLASGDRTQAVRALAAELGIEDWRAECTPADKLALVAALQREGRTVVMVGDGLNDAPVLAGADASVAVAGGSDVAQLTADLVLLGARVGELAAALAIARRTMAIIRQNFLWALGYNLVVLPLAMWGIIGPWEAAIGMAASSVIVVVNALRVFERTTSGSTWKASPSSFPSPSRSYS